MPKPDDLTLIQQLVFEQCGHNYTQPVYAAESKAYNACAFKVNGLDILFRSAKITPTKTGQFVTLWKRNGNGPIQPLDYEDEFEKIIVSVRAGDKVGCFIFDKDFLLDQGILAISGKGGKRAIRVYPPWDAANSEQARRSQHWQSLYFLDLSSPEIMNMTKAKSLLNATK